jgi:hypothetical protein
VTSLESASLYSSICTSTTVGTVANDLLYGRCSFSSPSQHNAIVDSRLGHGKRHDRNARAVASNSGHRDDQTKYVRLIETLYPKDKEEEDYVQMHLRVISSDMSNPTAMAHFIAVSSISQLHLATLVPRPLHSLLCRSILSCCWTLPCTSFR